MIDVNKQLNNSEECVICGQPILEDVEKWVRLTDFEFGIQTGEVYYHFECWKERFQITNSERKKKMYAQTSTAIKNIFNNIKGGSSRDKGGIPAV